MLRDGVPIGMVSVTRTEPGPFAPRHVDLLKSFADQAVIFRRKHNWLMCVLYLGTFGSFYVFYDLSRRLTLRAQAGQQSALDLIFTVRKD